MMGVLDRGLMPPFAAVTGTQRLQRLVFSAGRVTLEPLPAGTEADCGFCPREASHRLDCDAEPVLVCRSHGRAAAQALGEKVAAGG